MLTVASLTSMIGDITVAEQVHYALFCIATEMSERFDGRLPEVYEPSFAFSRHDLAAFGARTLSRYACCGQNVTASMEVLAFRLLTMDLVEDDE